MRRRLITYLLLILTTFFFTGSVFYLRGNARTGSPNTVTESAVLSLRRHVTKSLTELGRTPELSGHIVFFNRVPKCGSEMLVLLLQWLQGRNNFIHFRLKGGDKRKLSLGEQEELVQEVTSIIKERPVPLTFDRSTYFVNFTYFDKQSPTYVNLVRDPVDKLLSRFYYSRVPPNPDNPNLKWSPDKKIVAKVAQQNIEECVQQKKPECTFIDGVSYDLTIPYFCGQDQRCMSFNNKWALSTAKSNVERYFSTVGVLEELNATLEVFEHNLPYFFKGIQQVYFKNLFQPYHNKNRKKQQVKESIRKYFRNIFVTEYDFYEWVKSRLFQQLTIIYGHNH